MSTTICFETACSEDATELQDRGSFLFPPLKPFSLSGKNVVHHHTMTSPVHSAASPFLRCSLDLQ